MNKLCLIFCLAFAFSAHAQTKSKVVFVGDAFTYNWQNSTAFKANPNWIGAGVSSSGSSFNFGLSTAVAADFQTVLNQHPAIVFIETGTSDTGYQIDSTPFGLEWETSATAIIKMVQMAQKANVKVILGNIVPNNAYFSDFYNGWLQTFAQANNIPIVNLAAALTNGCAPRYSYTPCTLLAPVDPATWPQNVIPIPNDAGYQLITQLAQTAIATYGLTMKGGYLSDVESVVNYGFPNNPGGPSGPPTQVNSVTSGAGVQFIPQAVWSDGVARPMLNPPYNGVLGTWWSSNPKVMDVNQQGFAYAYTSGTATIWFKSASGHTFSPWIMTVSGWYADIVPEPVY
jgi:hypothetical protein